MFNKKQRFSIRKFKVGVFSVLVGSLFVLDPSSTVAAEEHSPIDVQVVEERVQPGSGEIAPETELPQAEPVEVSPTPAQSAELASETKVTPETAATVVKEDSAPSISEEPAAEEKVTTEGKPVAQAPETAETTTNKETPQVEAQATTKEVETPAEKVESKPATTTSSSFRSGFRSAGFRNAETTSSGVTVEKVANLDDVEYGVYGFSPTINKNSVVEAYNGANFRPSRRFQGKFPINVNSAILHRDPKTIENKPYVIIKNVGEYQGRQLDMKLEYADWKRMLVQNTGNQVYGQANSILDIGRIITGTGLQMHMQGMDYITMRETYLDSATGETVSVKANKTLLDIDRQELFAISNNSNASIQKTSDEITVQPTTSAVGNVIYNNTTGAPRNYRDKDTKETIFDTDHRINVSYDATADKPFEYSFLARKNEIRSKDIYENANNRNQNLAKVQENLDKYYASNNSTKNPRKVNRYYYEKPQTNRYIWGKIINEDVEPDIPVQYVSDADEGHTTTTLEDGERIDNDPVELVTIAKPNEEVSFRNQTSTTFKVSGEPLTQLVFTQKLDDKLTYKNGSLKVYLGEDDNGNPKDVTSQGRTNYDAATRTLTWTANNALLTKEESQGEPLTVDFKATANAPGNGQIINPAATFKIDKDELQTNRTKIIYGNFVPPTTDALEEEVAKQEEVLPSTNYENADQDKKDAYDQALAKGEEVLNNANATQADVDAAKEALEAARNALNGDSKPEAVDKSALEAEVANEDEVTASDDYTKAAEEAKKAYDDALAAAKEVLADPAATAEQVAAAKEALSNAAENLAKNPAPEAVDKSELEVEAAKEDEVTASDAYTKATEEAKKAYDDALAAAKEVLADPAAT
ncbi:YSIRK-type signal peptide-containing protein, partial [Streptococcus sp. NLN76]|uniref:YSIRK-type signal peptide-containing protein n=1 Tax=Streptococcus sp. NLN76 TaxID=2822800 RepID=UPI0018AB45ED